MKAVLFLLQIVWKVLKGVAMLSLALIVLSIAVDVPGCRRFSRYVAHADLREMLAEEKDDIWNVFTFQQDGSNYTVVVVGACRCLASGPGVLVYDAGGKLVDKSIDIGDWHIEVRWNFTQEDVYRKHAAPTGDDGLREQGQ